MEASTPTTPEHAPGWYEFHGGQRFWDGERWTEHMAPPPQRPKHEVEPMGFLETTGAVALGVLVAWGLIYLGAQLDPDSIYTVAARGCL